MSKSLSSLWLKSVRRIGRAQKAQQAQGRKLLFSLLSSPAAKSAAKPKRRRAKVAPVLQAVEAVTPALPRTKAPRLVKARPAIDASSKNIPEAIAKVLIKALVKPSPVSRSRVTALPRPAAAGAWKSLTFTCAASADAPAGRMAYWLYLPSRTSTPLGDASPADGAGKVGRARPATGRGDPSTAPMPLVVMLHGCEQSATDFATSTRMNTLAEREGFAVLYPQQSASGDAHRCWHWYKRPTQEGHGDVRLIAALIAQVQARHGLDTRRTYLAGLSAGAGLASILALRHPQLIAAVGLHSSPVFGTSDSPMNAYGVMQHGSAMAHSDAAHTLVKGAPGFPGMPVMLVHGSHDTVVRAVNAQQLAAQFGIVNAPALGAAPPVVREFAARGGRTPRLGWRTTTWYAGRKPQIVKVDIDGLGHAWSGGDASVPFSEPAGPDVTTLMWRFFSRQQRAPRPAPQSAAPDEVA